MNEIILTGKVKKFDKEEKQVSPSYTKRELVIVTEEQFPQTIMIEFSQGKCNSQLDSLKADDLVSVSVNIGGREWVNPQGEPKYFNSIKGWKISKDTGTHTVGEGSQETQAKVAQAPAMPVAQAFEPMANFNEEEHDDLPF